MTSQIAETWPARGTYLSSSLKFWAAMYCGHRLKRKKPEMDPFVPYSPPTPRMIAFARRFSGGTISGSLGFTLISVRPPSHPTRARVSATAGSRSKRFIFILARLLRSHRQVDTDAARGWNLCVLHPLDIGGVEPGFRIDVRYVGAPECQVPADEGHVQPGHSKAVSERT